MAYTAPITFVNGVPLTAAQMNAIQDNIRETAVAKATTASRYFAVTGPNAIAERALVRQTVDVVADTTSTSYTGTLTGPSTGPTVTATSGDKAIVGVYSYVRNTVAGQSALASYAVSGATTRASTDADAVLSVGDGTVAIQATCTTASFFMTPGSNTFTMQFRVSGGTGRFDNRRLWVYPL